MWTRSQSTMLLLLLAATACGTNRDVPPVSPTAPTQPAAPTIITVRLEGTTIDADRDAPIPGTFVRVQSVNPGGLREAAGATTDDRGVFAFTADLPSGWRYLVLVGSRTGYEPNISSIYPDAVASGQVRLQPTLTVRPGESLKTRVFKHGFTCYDEGYPCRRVVLDSADSVDIEVTPADSNAEVGLQAGAPAYFPYRPVFDRRITISGGEFWVVGGVAGEPFMWVTLTATRH